LRINNIGWSFLGLLPHLGGRLYWSTSTSISHGAVNDSDMTLLMDDSDIEITGLAFLAGNIYYVDRYSRYTDTL